MAPTPTQKAAQAMIRRLPTSVRQLARESGLSHTKILRAARGEGGLTRDEVEAIAGALERWSDECSDLANLLRAASREKGD